MKPTILIVDDEPGVRSSLSGVLRDEGYSVEAVSTGEACLDRVTRSPVDLIVLDVWMPGMDGLATLQKLRDRQVDTPVVLISGHGSIESAVKAIKLGAFDFVEKPLSIDKTLLVVRNALRQRSLEDENRALRARVDRTRTMVGESDLMRQLRDQVAMAAPSNGRVLIYGENGTGKELVARTVHSLSRRRNGPFVEVNCAAIPEELIESELFGHTKGSFTGATATRKGKFEAADAGTLFLDEIGDMTLELQSRLLRAIQSGEFFRVGGRSPIHVDVRVIAATHRNLQELIQRGAFREDLYYRLNVAQVRLPALRERGGDIPLLVTHFAAEAARELATTPKSFSRAALTALERHPWPGNVRELQNEIRRLTALLGDRTTVEVGDLSESLRAGQVDVPADVLGKTWKELMDAEERRILAHSLRLAGGNKLEAARRLGITLRGLYKILERHGGVAGVQPDGA